MADGKGKRAGGGSGSSWLLRTSRRAFRPAHLEERGKETRLAAIVSTVLGRRLGAPWGLFAILVFLVVVSVWTRHAVNESLTDVMSGKLTTILDADVKGLEIWINNEEGHVRSWAADEEVRATILELRRIGLSSPNPREALVAAPQLPVFQELLDSVPLDEDIEGFVAVDRSGLVLASDPTAEIVIGRLPTASGLTHVGPMLTGDATFLRPMPRRDLWDIPDRPASDEAMLRKPIIGVAAHLRDGQGNVLCALIFRLNA
ncbi:MAG: hypothetical protein ACYS0D_06630, partial [Planctomycetota bacterium]